MMRLQREYEDQQALIVKNESPHFGPKKNQDDLTAGDHDDEYMLSTEE